jgi:hypothetical protein
MTDDIETEFDQDYDQELLNLSNNQRDILDECDDNLERLKTTYINTLIDIQHSLNELKKRELENNSYNDTHNEYDNYQETITELLDTPFDFVSNMDRLHTITQPTYNNTFGSYRNLINNNDNNGNGNNGNGNNGNANNNNTNNTNNNSNRINDAIYNEGYRRIIENINLSDKTKFKRLNNGTLKECNICYKEKQYFIEILSCKHSFCNGCVKQWIKEHTTCPMCRSDI